MRSVNWVEKLKRRWKLNNTYQVIIVLLVFACTGFTVLFMKAPIRDLIDPGKTSSLYTILYFIFILPVYNIILLIYGFIFGQFKFFWKYERRFFDRIFGRKG